jgi:hypothetical protein
MAQVRLDRHPKSGIDPCVKTTLKILAGLAAVAILWLGYMYVRWLHDDDLHCDTATVTGVITPETFVKLRGCLARSLEPKKRFVITSSEGGDSIAALALGILIHRHHWDVEIVDFCASACANFIFPAGKTKYLDRHSMLLFHGGPYQENLLQFASMFKLVPSTSDAPAEAVILGHVNKENTLSTGPISPAYRQLHQFLSIPDDSTPVELVLALRKASDQFYEELGVNPLLSIYGQRGAYEPKYRSYGEDIGFVYRLDSLRRLGIGNIELKDGEWHPERNPVYQKVYEVTYP